MKFISSKFIREFDLFSKPFEFFVGDKKSKSTLIGGFLSLSIIIVSLVYFYYLINLYFQNKIEPRITSSIQIENEKNTIQIEDNFFIMEMLIQGEPLKRYERRVGKQYLSYTIFYEQYKSDGSNQTQSLPLVECNDPKFDGFLCLDQSAFNSNKDIYMEPINQISSDFAIMVTPCDSTQNLNCATEEEIQKLIFQQTNYFQVYTRIKQYNPTLRQYQNGYKSEFFYFDPKMIVYTRMSLIRATTSVIEGLLIQNTDVQNNIFDYKRYDTYFTKEGLYERMAIEGFAYIVFELNQVHNQIVIQHAMVTEVLAQFMSIFNSMLTIGILARMLAQSHIVEDMNNMLLKEYYKKTALKLVQKKEIRKKSIILENGDGTTKAHEVTARVGVGFSSHTLGKTPSIREQSPEKRKTNYIVETQRKICETNFAEKQRQYFKISLWERVKLFTQKIFGKNSKSSIKDDPNSDPNLYKSLLKQSMKRINIFEVYKDLIKLKMAIKLMLTKDQYAAIQFCGSDISQEDQIESIMKNKYQKVEVQCDKKQVTQIPPQTNDYRNGGLLTAQQQPSQFIPSLIGQEISVINCPFSQLGNEYQENKQDKMNINQEHKIQEIQKNALENNLNKITENFEDSSLQNCKTQQKSQIICSINSNSQDFSENLNNFKKEIFLDSIEQRLDQQMKQYNKQSQQNITHENISICKANPALKGTAKLKKDDHIQGLQIKGDQSEIKYQDISIEIQAEDEHENIKQINLAQPTRFHQENLNTNLLQEGCHLKEMDKIEESQEEQERFLKLFLIRMKDSNNQENFDKINQIDKQIYQSLLINEQIPHAQIRTLPDQALLNKLYVPSSENLRYISGQMIQSPQGSLSKNTLLGSKQQ